jgi:hypothetical protein
VDESPLGVGAIALFENLARHVDFLIQRMSNGSISDQLIDEEQERWKTSLLLVNGVGFSLHSMRAIISNNILGVRDCFAISRSLCETALNVSLITL